GPLGTGALVTHITVWPAASHTAGTVKNGIVTRPVAVSDSGSVTVMVTGPVVGAAPMLETNTLMTPSPPGGRSVGRALPKARSPGPASAATAASARTRSVKTLRASA